ncbi:MAG: hypothetical protein ACREJ1_11015, partial [Candidatus Methylomirabilales bacterium]
VRAIESSSAILPESDACETKSHGALTLCPVAKFSEPAVKALRAVRRGAEATYTYDGHLNQSSH